MGRSWLRRRTCLHLSLPVSALPPTVYKEGFYVALSNLPGNIFTILLMDSTGGKVLLCEPDSCTILPALGVARMTMLWYFPELHRTGCFQTFTVLCCSLQPGPVQSEHLPHLCGPDPGSELDPVLRLQWCVSDQLEFSGRFGDRALPDAATVHFSTALPRQFWWIRLDGLVFLFRSSALGFFTGVGRVAAIAANIVFGKLVDTNCAVPVLLVSFLLLTGGLVALLLPQTKQTELT